LKFYFLKIKTFLKTNFFVQLIFKFFFNSFNKAGFSVENYLDVEIVASVAPKANITFYFAPNSFQSFYSVLNTALKHSHVVSCSWDSREDVTSAYWASFNALFSKYPNVPIFIATGDQGSNGAVGFPASCPNVISKILIFKCPNFHLLFQSFLHFEKVVVELV
jgi:subtilase family serine protease